MVGVGKCAQMPTEKMCDVEFKKICCREISQNLYNVYINVWNTWLAVKDFHTMDISMHIIWELNKIWC